MMVLRAGLCVSILICYPLSLMYISLKLVIESCEFHILRTGVTIFTNRFLITNKFHHDGPSSRIEHSLPPF